MSHESSSNSRRQFLANSTYGVASVALGSLLQQDKLLAAPAKPPLEQESFNLTQKTPVEPPRANAMISLFMQGGPSHHDLFDPKPEMQKWHMKPFPGKIKYDNAAQASSKIYATPWKFDKYGQSGMDVSELLPHFQEIVDDVTLIRSMHTGVNNHGQSIYALNSGRSLKGRPALGSWLTYGLGSETQNLPAYVALTDPTSLPVTGVDLWSNGFLPSIYQGTVVRSKEPRILNLDVPHHLKGNTQANYLNFLQEINQNHLKDRPGEHDLDARISSYELAARMQGSAREALDLSQETKATQEMYGIGQKETDEYGKRCLIARRLVERGVRCVQLFNRYQLWDHHGNILNLLPAHCRIVDQPSAALVKDLKQRGLLDSTIVHWGGEMGRLPVIQNEKSIGRDHNTYGFSQWMAGGGFKAGYTHGATDEWGHHAVEDVVNHYDYHATLLHLFGLDPYSFTFRNNGREQSLLDGQQGKVVNELLT
ncbi:hypothetical protein Pla110_10390 [Polystyrenella longa]|uniref:Sulfatase n=1 Tax=Polystyrenella longa TaxID=2528007 RepID=A0A518CJC5_9PLAN|nr:DUF1501 domain-containing protein [Polystyrenella longa]QDU79331.1 hypothetical protein Pla110_10390 [Polystyrenella longa]